MKLSCFIYAIKTGDHVHYVGSTFNVQFRAKALLQRGKESVRELLRNGASVETLAECQQRRGYKVERLTILSYKQKGQCELNVTLPSARCTDRARTSNTLSCHPVQTPDGKRLFKSKSDAARRLGWSIPTITNMMKRGELIESPSAWTRLNEIGSCDSPTS